MAKFLFESQTCSSCHGSAKYSFCEMYRDACFKCSGLGICLTKRGSGGISAPDEHTVRVYRPDDSARLQEALDYQATLTKSGTVRKKKAHGASPLLAAPYTQNCPDRSDEWKVKAGKLANGFERGKGIVAHLVEKDSYAGASLCGEKPAVQWTTSENPKYCLKCSRLKRITK